MTKLKQAFLLLSPVILIIAAIIGQKSLARAWRSNLLMVQAARVVLAQDSRLPQAYHALLKAGVSDCNLEWGLGKIAGKLGSPALRQLHWASYLRCNTPKALSLVHAGAAGDVALAQSAIALYPERAESWSWLASILDQTGHHSEATIAYQRSLDINPVQGKAWCRLGNLLRSEDVQKAESAYLHCCMQGDPGSNGCYNAGRIEEEKGDLRTAILYYRLSRWDQARKRADELEK